MVGTHWVPGVASSHSETLTSVLKVATLFAATGWHTLPSVPRRRALQSFNNFE